ncbi:lipocalin-like protein [Aminobacter aminovorans]|uniref:Lipocalin-like domain-containing protein n=1 Tax=Aminobacter aminovorans TaxID=83263 RepID=A0A381ILR5_AMIAI|nr:lipocalin-like protein [Aminobacter aminovorans]SUY28429.1 Uncharacterised protein [Aminobacter aminovorans]
MDQCATSTATLEDLLGTWRLLSVSSWRDDQLHDAHPYGHFPVGFIHYLPDGRMSVIIAYGQRPTLSGDRLDSSVEERAGAYSSIIAYAGTYELVGGTIVHRIEVSAYPNEIGSKQIRHFHIADNRVHLTTVPLRRGGIPTVYKLIWER